MASKEIYGAGVKRGSVESTEGVRVILDTASATAGYRETTVSTLHQLGNNVARDMDRGRDPPPLVFSISMVQGKVRRQELFTQELPYHILVNTECCSCPDARGPPRRPLN